MEYRGVYDGIDMVYYGNQRQLEYDFIVVPGADPGVITLGFAGADRLEIDTAGELAVPASGFALARPAPVSESWESKRMADDWTNELLQLNARLLKSIATGDWAAYQELCDPSLTAFEPEAMGQLVEGMDFHRFYFELGGFRGPHHTTMCSPRVRVMGDVAVIAYVRLNQRVGVDGVPYTAAFEETRVWQRQNGRWRHVHFHRSEARPQPS